MVWNEETEILSPNPPVPRIPGPDKENKETRGRVLPYIVSIDC
jgi:hypothetical protein